MVRILVTAFACVAMVCDAASAQERTAPAAPVSSTPLRVQVVLSRYDGDRKLASMPYTLLVNAGERDNRVTLRMGVALPITGVGAGGPTVTLQDIGTNMDCTATLAEEGRYRINLAVNHTSVYENDQRHLLAVVPRAGDAAQLIRSFTSSFFVLLRDQQSAQSIAATDPVTGEVMKIDVTIAVVK